MGCCVANDLTQELSLDEIDNFNKLNSEINQILYNRNNINLQNSDVLLKLINKISIKISNCEEIIDKIKLKRLNSKVLSESYQIINNNINKLKEYSKFLNSKIIQNRKEILEKENLFLRESGTKTIISVNESQLRANNNKFLNNFIYQKKLIKRSTKSDTP